ncbi:hypothetical protein P5W99_36030 [Paraburkholderia sp. A3BS-1L]|uniref:hypothetical protein n=1 Tax=Paraburkholderia sp. A3BS-1L TaxID=3028375 RepID=UPI003DA9FC7D
MSDKFEMEVTINPLLFPLLHERLRRCASARERAAVLKSLAEGMLRQESMRDAAPVRVDAGVPSPAPLAAAARTPPPQRAQGVGPARNAANVPEGIQALRVGEAADDAPSFDDALGGDLANLVDFSF